MGRRVAAMMAAAGRWLGACSQVSAGLGLGGSWRVLAVRRLGSGRMAAAALRLGGGPQPTRCFFTPDAQNAPSDLFKRSHEEEEQVEFQLGGV